MRRIFEEKQGDRANINYELEIMKYEGDRVETMHALSLHMPFLCIMPCPYASGAFNNPSISFSLPNKTIWSPDFSCWLADGKPSDFFFR